MLIKWAQETQLRRDEQRMDLIILLSNPSSLLKLARPKLWLQHLQKEMLRNINYDSQEDLDENSQIQ